jgi:cysteine-rich repeat protein
LRCRTDGEDHGVCACAHNQVQERGSFTCSDADGDGEGICVSGLLPTAPCDPEDPQSACLSFFEQFGVALPEGGYEDVSLYLPGACLDLDGDGSFTCTARCPSTPVGVEPCGPNVVQSYEEPLFFRLACSDPEGDGQGWCLPLVGEEETCDPAGLLNACPIHRCDVQVDEHSSASRACEAGVCRESFADAPPFCTRLCDPAAPDDCNTRYSDTTCHDPDGDGEGWCVPFVGPGEACDRTGIGNVCAHEIGWRTLLQDVCIANPDEKNGLCVTSCDVPGLRCPSEGYSGEASTATFCLEPASAPGAYCAPIVEDLETCDPSMTADVCTPAPLHMRHACVEQIAGGSVCLRPGTCEHPLDLNAIGVTGDPTLLRAWGDPSHAQDDEASIGCTTTGKDQVWRISLAEESRVRVTLLGDDYSDTVIFARTECGDLISEVGCEDVTGTGEVLDLGVHAAGAELFVVVDEFSEGSSWFGPYWIEARLIPVLALEEDCEPMLPDPGCPDGAFCHPDDHACAVTECGDGFVSGEEECDDGGVLPDDGCDAECKVEVFEEVERNDDLDRANLILPGMVVSGESDGYSLRDTFAFDVPEDGRSYSFFVSLSAGEAGCDGQSGLYIGRQVSEEPIVLEDVCSAGRTWPMTDGSRSYPDKDTDDMGCPRYDSRWGFAEMPPGRYFVMVIFGFTKGIAYRLRIDRHEVSLAAENEPCGPGAGTEICAWGLECLPVVDSPGSRICRPPACGDGFVSGDEQCDDANDQPGDGCDACTVEVMDETEPNNLKEVANELGVHRAARATVARSRDADFFALDLDQTASVKAWVARDDEGACPVGGTLRLHDAESTEIASASDCDAVDPISEEAVRDLIAGRYFVSFTHDGGGFDPEVPYVVRVELGPTPVEGEPCSDARDRLPCVAGLACSAASGACLQPTCGDGVTTIEAGEQCDDGGQEPGDGCGAECKWESFEEAEPNGSAEEASQPTVGHCRWTGVVDGYGDHDWYEVSSDVAFAAHVKLSAPDGSCSTAYSRVAVDVMDASGLFAELSATWRNDYAAGPICPLIAPASEESRGTASLLPAGTYFVRVRVPWDAETTMPPLPYEVWWRGGACRDIGGPLPNGAPEGQP